jgi:hypothetical protein
MLSQYSAMDEVICHDVEHNFHLAFDEELL